MCGLDTAATVELALKDLYLLFVVGFSVRVDFCCRLLCESGCLCFWFEGDQWEYFLLLDESRCPFGV